jgi:hypothetical protein
MVGGSGGATGGGQAKPPSVAGGILGGVISASPGGVLGAVLGKPPSAVPVGRRDLGGIDLGKACVDQNGPAYKAVLIGPANAPAAAFLWQCRGPGAIRPVDFAKACKTKHGPNALAAPRNPSDAFSWRCTAR